MSVAAFRNDVPVFDADHTLRVLRDIGFVRHHHDGRAFAVQVVQQVHDLHAGDGIEIARRFVGQNQRRAIDQRAGDGDALLLPAR